MSEARMCYTEPICVSCPVCGVEVTQWCLKDGRERKWVEGTPVHLERIEAVNKEYPPRPYPTGYRDGKPVWGLATLRMRCDPKNER